MSVEVGPIRSSAGESWRLRAARSVAIIRVRKLTHKLPRRGADEEGDEVRHEREYPKDARVVVSGTASKRLRPAADRDRCARAKQSENSPAPDDHAECEPEQQARQADDHEKAQHSHGERIGVFPPLR